MQTNKIITTNKKIKYMFLLWEGFKAQLVQMYGDFLKKKLQLKSFTSSGK